MKSQRHRSSLREIANLPQLCFVAIVIPMVLGQLYGCDAALPYGYAIALDIRLPGRGCVQDSNTHRIVTWGKQKLPFSDTGNGFTSTATFYAPPPEVVTVSWDENGERISATGKISRKARSAYRNVDSYHVILLSENRLVVWPSFSNSLDELPYYGASKLKAIAGANPVFFVGVKNATKQTIRGLKLTLGSESLICDENGRLKPAVKHPTRGWRGHKGWKFGQGSPFELAASAEISWRDKDGLEHVRQLEFADELPQNVSHQTLCFVILENGKIEFLVQPWKDRDKWKMKKYFGVE